MRLRFILFLFLISPLVSLASDFYRLDPNLQMALKSEDRKEIKDFFLQMEGMLPPKLKSAFTSGIWVTFKDLREVRGTSTSSTVTLNSNLIPSILKGEKQSDIARDQAGRIRTHKTVFKEAQAVVIHETIHAYDFLNVKSESEKAFIQQCQFMSQDPDIPKAEGCEVYLKTNTTLSSDPYYLEVAGWPLAVQGQDFREKHNIFRQRTADPYEFHNAREHLAVNFEYFLLDPDFSCRKPSLASFFESHFQFKPFKTACDSWFYIDPSANKPENLIKSIPFDRVYQIHYLHADRGQDVMSKWGHSMFRVIICAPQRKFIGPDCMKDEYHHLVLSFRAFIDTYEIQSWRGLTGQYPSRLFFIPLEQVKKDYNVKEFRDVHSYPMQLTSGQMLSFLKRALEIHWNYSSSYFFVTNNCATESLNLLRSSVLRADLISKKVIKPAELRDLLVNSKLIDLKSRPRNRIDSFNAGLTFLNHADRHLKALTEISGKKETISSTVTFLDSNFQIRQDLYRKVTNPSLKQLAAQVILESAALERISSKAQAAVFDQVVKISKESSDKSWATEIQKSLDQSIAFLNAFSAPYEFLKDSTYGIPLLAEIGILREQAQKLHAENQQNTKLRRTLIDKNYTEKQQLEIQNTANNLVAIQAEMLDRFAKEKRN